MPTRYPSVVLLCPTAGIFRLRLCIACFLGCIALMSILCVSDTSRFPSGGGGSVSLSKIASLSMLEDQDTSVRSTLDLGSRTLSIMRQFVADVADIEKDYEKGTDASVSELNVKGSHRVKDTRTDLRHATLNEETIKALRKLIEEFEDQLQCPNEGCEDTTSDEGQEEDPLSGVTTNSIALVQKDEENEEVPASKEPQLHLCDDWIQPMAAMSRPRKLTAKENVKANVAKNCLIVTLMSLELGYGPILERYQQEGESLAQRYEQSRLGLKANFEYSPI